MQFDKDAYAIRNYRREDEPQVLNLLENCFADSLAGYNIREMWRWKHFKNPFGTSYIRVANKNNGDIIGLSAFMRWRLRLGNRQIKSVRAVDLAVHPQYRGLGIATRITKNNVDQAKENGARIIFNTPNDSSISISRKRGRLELGLIYPYIRIINWFEFIKMAIRKKLMRELGTTYVNRKSISSDIDMIPFKTFIDATPELAVLCQKSDDSLILRTDRNLDYLRWRYAEHPWFTYYVLPVRQSKKVNAFAIYRITQKAFTEGVFLHDIILDNSIHFSTLELVKEFKRTNRNYIFGHFAKVSLGTNPLGIFGTRISKAPYNLTVGIFDTEFSEIAGKLSNWSLTSGDLEEF